jgi:hypothetical protein
MEKLVKQIKLNKHDLNGLKIVGLQAYSEESHYCSKGKKETNFFFLTDYKGYKSHKRIYGTQNCLSKKDIPMQMKKIIKSEWILSKEGQDFAKENSGRMSK